MQLLKKALPSFVSPLVDHFIVNAGGLDVARELGIGAFRSENVVCRVRRYDLLCEVTLPEKLAQAEGVMLARLAEKAEKSGTEVKAASASAISRQFRQIVEKDRVLTNAKQATKQRLAEANPELVEIMREIVRANAGDDVLYKKGETPVDQLLYQRSERGAGGQEHGQEERFTRLLNVAVAERGLGKLPTVDGGI